MAKSVAAKYQEIAGIDMICVGGSTAIGNAYSKSDVDMWATYSQLPSSTERQNIVHKLIEEYGNEPQPRYATEGRGDSLRIDGIDVHIILGHNDEFLQLPKNREEVMGTPYEVGIADFFDSVVLYDSKGIWKQVETELEDYPVNIGIRIIGENLDKIITVLQDDMQKAIMTQSSFLVLEVQGPSLERFLRILFALNKRYYRRLRDISAVISGLKILPRDCELRLKAYAKEKFPSEMHIILFGLVNDTLPLIKESYPEIAIDEVSRQLERR